MTIKTDRRSLLSAIPAVAVVATVPAAAITLHPDAAIIAAWERRGAARREYDALPEDKWGQHDGYTPEEIRLWAIMDEAEDTIQSAIAKTSEGVAVQIWVALARIITSRDEEAATVDRDLAYFIAREQSFDWEIRVLIAALRSLESQGR